jgi:hypothetical protein
MAQPTADPKLTARFGVRKNFRYAGQLCTTYALGISLLKDFVMGRTCNRIVSSTAIRRSLSSMLSLKSEGRLATQPNSSISTSEAQRCARNAAGDLSSSPKKIPHHAGSGGDLLCTAQFETNHQAVVDDVAGLRTPTRDDPCRASGGTHSDRRSFVSIGGSTTLVGQLPIETMCPDPPDRS